MRTTIQVLSILIAAGLASASPAQSPKSDSKIDLRVLFVGAAPDGQGKAAERAARTRDFADFLGREFKSVRVVSREGFDPASAQDADVVMLDWSQSEIDFGKMRELRSPLGARGTWNHPTVLLGSAGLLLAGPWQLKGAHG